MTPDTGTGTDTDTDTRHRHRHRHLQYPCQDSNLQIDKCTVCTEPVLASYSVYTGGWWVGTCRDGYMVVQGGTGTYYQGWGLAN